MTCRDCLHAGVCYMVERYGVDLEEDRQEYDCNQFTDKSRFVELPCKIGDVVYIENGDDETPHFVDSGKVFAIGIDENEFMWISVRYESGLKYYHTSDDIGKTVFPTQEAAEAAINKKEKNHEDN